MALIPSMSKCTLEWKDFYPSRTSINLFWGFFWRAGLFSLPFLSIASMVSNSLLTLWAQVHFESVVGFLVWKQQYPAEWSLISQLIIGVVAFLPAMILAWWMLLTCPIYRTYSFRHVRYAKKDGVAQPHLAHGFVGAVQLGWSTFWRLMVNLLPIYMMMFVLQKYQIFLASTTLAPLPGYSTALILLSITAFYIYPLTLHHMVMGKHKCFSFTLRPHTHKELMDGFVPEEANGTETTAAA